MKGEKRERVEKIIKRGSLTVEASFLIPFLLFIIFAMLCLCLYLHDRSVLASCAAEAAGKGAQKKYVQAERLEEWAAGEARGLAAGRLLSLREFQISAKVTGQEITVSYLGTTGLLGGLKIQGQETARRLDTVKRIRRSRQLEELLKG